MHSPTSPEATPRPRAPRLAPDSPARFEGPEPAWLTDTDTEQVAPPSPPCGKSCIRRLPPLSDEELSRMPFASAAGLGLDFGIGAEPQIPPASPEREVPATPKIGSQDNGRFDSVRLPSPVSKLVPKDDPEACIPVVRKPSAPMMTRETVGILEAMPSSATVTGLGIKSAEPESLTSMMRNVKIAAEPRRAFGARPVNSRSKPVDLGLAKLNIGAQKPSVSKAKQVSVPPELLDENGAPKVLHCRRTSTSAMDPRRRRSSISGGAMARERAAFAVTASMRRYEGASRPIRALR